jgi:outer membrane immunogenic protein
MFDWAEGGLAMNRYITTPLAIAGLSLGLIGAASAADLTPVYKGPPAPYDYWSGFYAGVNLGWGLDQIDNTAFAPASGTTTFDSFQRSGVLGGGQIGYNWLFYNSWLLGIEADIDGADIDGTNTHCNAPGCSSADGRTDVFGTARGRIGFVQNSWLLYATGGFAYAHNTNDRTIVAVTNPAEAVLVGQSSNQSGWDGGWTAGGGVEWAFAHNWSAKLEYLFAEIDISRIYTYAGPAADPTAGDRNISSRLDYNIVRAGVNYRFAP